MINCNEFERKKYIIDTETRIKNLVHFEEAFFDWYCSDENLEDEFLEEKKKRELLNQYNLPLNITYNPEFKPSRDMNLMIRLTKKWISKKASIKEIYEMIFLIDWYHELDLPYILWEFPNDSLHDSETYDFCFWAPYLINEKKKISHETIRKESVKVWSEYFDNGLNPNVLKKLNIDLHSYH